MSPLRRLAPLTAALLAAAALAAGCTGYTQTCKDGVCTLTITGKGSQTTLGGEGGSPIELIEAKDGVAKVRIGTTTGEMRKGQTINLNNGTIEVEEVSDDKIKLKVRGGGAAGGSSGSGSTN